MSDENQADAGASRQERQEGPREPVVAEEWPRRTTPSTVRFIQAIIRADTTRQFSGEPRRFLG